MTRSLTLHGIRLSRAIRSMKRSHINFGMNLHRLLLAAVVWIAPLVPKLPCCCLNRAVASVDSCAVKSEKKSCCSKETASILKQQRCCRNDSHAQSQGRAGRPRPSCCECCPQFFVLEGNTGQAKTQTARDSTQSGFWIPLLIDLDQSQCFSMNTIGQPPCSSAGHNRLQSVLCVWRN